MLISEWESESSLDRKRENFSKRGNRNGQTQREAPRSGMEMVNTTRRHGRPALLSLQPERHWKQLLFTFSLHDSLSS